MINKWECYKCASDQNDEDSPSGWLANYHPLCLECANAIYYNNSDPNRFRLTYHVEFGNLEIFENHLVSVKSPLLN